MKQTYLPGKIRDRIQDLMKSNKVTQTELAARIGCSESMLSRFISGKSDKPGDESIIRIARVFHVCLPDDAAQHWSLTCVLQRLLYPKNEYLQYFLYDRREYKDGRNPVSFAKMTGTKG